MRYQTIEKEMQELIKSKTFTAVDEFPHEKKAVGSRWVLSFSLIRMGKTLRRRLDS